MRSAAAVAFAAVILSSKLLADAHHSPTQFDHEREVTLAGVVVDVEWSNPHVRFRVKAQDTRGRRVTWLVEAQSPRVLSLFGWSPSSLRAGERVTIWAHPLRNSDAPTVLGSSVRVASGAVLDIPWEPQKIRDALRAESQQGR